MKPAAANSQLGLVGHSREAILDHAKINIFLFRAKLKTSSENSRARFIFVFKWVQHRAVAMNPHGLAVCRSA